MAEQSSDNKTEQPTEKKKRDTRKKGQFAKSTDLGKLVPVFFVLSSLFLFSNVFVSKCSKMYLAVFAQLSTDSPISFNLILNLLAEAIKPLLLLMGCVSVIAIACQIVQMDGLVIIEEPFKLKFDRMNFVNNAKNIFSKKNLIKFLIDVIKLAITFVLIWYILFNTGKNLIYAVSHNIVVQESITVSILQYSLTVLLVVYFICTVLDIYFTRKDHNKKLMMSLEEVKKEYKETEGNPEIKQKRKELHQEIIDSDAMNGTINKSTLILANPTHIAVAVVFNPKKFPLPVVLIKVSGSLAQEVFKIAEKNNIPIVQDKWLARSLYAYALVGKPIPKRFYGPITDVFRQNITRLPKLQAEMLELGRVFK